MTTVHVVGMSHIDLGFIMTEAELSELLEIFAERMLSVLEKNPEIYYAIEQAAHYRTLQRRRPDLIEKIKSYIDLGRIEVMGAMASSMETNFPNGECFIRNQSLGLKWVGEHFGVKPESAWLVDTFGLHAQIPQIYQQFGFQQLFANRFGGDKRDDIFYAKGIDGTELLVIGKDSASGNVLKNSQAFKLCRSWNDTKILFQEADALNGTVPRLVVNYIENEEVLSLRYAALTKERDGKNGVSWKLSSYPDYVRALKQSAVDFPRINADLNPEFTGTFSLRTPLRVHNRRSETALLEAEKWSAWLTPHKNAGAFEDFWWDMAFVQFHDVFSGSHGDETYHSVLQKLAHAQTFADDTVQMAVASVSENGNDFVCVNGLPWQRQEWVCLSEKNQNHRISQFGNELPVVTRDGKQYARVTVPATGLATIHVDEPSQPVAESVSSPSKVIRNEFMALELDEKDGIRSLALADGTILMQNVADFFTVQEDIGGFQIEMPVNGELFAMSGKVRLSSAVQDAMGMRIVLSGEFPTMNWNKGANRLQWSAQFSLNAGENALRLHLAVDWFGEGTRIRLNFPTTVDSSTATYEIPFGVTERKAYRPRATAKGEWPAHRFVAIEDQQKGFALVNQGVAGVEVIGNMLSTTLIRAYYPGPMAWVPPTAETSQHGHHEYDFLLIPYEGSFRNANVCQYAQAFNNNLQLVENRSLKLETLSFLSIDAPNLVLSSVKSADDGSGDLIIRYYETFGIPTNGTLRIPSAEQVSLSDVTERHGEMLYCNNGEIPVSCKPFEIQTLRIQQKNIIAP